MDCLFLPLFLSLPHHHSNSSYSSYFTLKEAILQFMAGCLLGELQDIPVVGGIYDKANSDQICHLWCTIFGCDESLREGSIYHFFKFSFLPRSSVKVISDIRNIISILPFACYCWNTIICQTSLPVINGHCSNSSLLMRLVFSQLIRPHAQLLLWSLMLSCVR